MVAGLEVPDSGTIEFDGEDVTQVPVRDRGIGFCFQHYAPFRHLTVRKNVAFGLEVRKRPKAEIRAKVDELLDLVKIDHLADRYPSQLSGGQRQRMALARALAIEPQLLLLDEPFGALDAQVRQELRVWLRDLHEKISVTTVLVTHDQEEAMEVADNLAIINQGRLEQIGRPAEMYDHPTNEFVMKFLGPATQLDGSWVRPHDLVIHRDEGVGQYAGTVERVTHLGFEVRVDVQMDRGEPTWVQLSRGAAAEIDLAAGDPVWISRAGSGPTAAAADRGRCSLNRRSAPRGSRVDEGPVSASGSPPDGAVHQLADQVGVSVVAGVLLDHVVVDPPEGARLPLPRPGVVEVQRCRGAAGGLALGLPGSHVLVPVGVVEREELTVVGPGAGPDVRCVGLIEQRPAEPVALDLGHVTDQAMQREERGRDGTSLSRRVVESLALEEQRGPVELQPCFQHGPLVKHVRGLGASAVHDVLDHGTLLWYRPWAMRTPEQPVRGPSEPDPVLRLAAALAYPDRTIGLSIRRTAGMGRPAYRSRNAWRRVA